MKCSSVHFTATLSNLNQFQYFCSDETATMYKTGHAFTYLLLKESVANDVIMCHCLLFVNHAIDECRRRLSACLHAEGGHFEHYL